MAYFAKLDNDNKVTGVQSVNDNVILDENNVEQEQKGIDFLKSLFGGEWKQTSYNTHRGKYYLTNAETGQRTLHEDQSKVFRANYAGIGFVYDAINDVFHASQPYPSWTLSGAPEWAWQPPVAKPSDESKFWVWNEDTQAWDELAESDLPNQY